MIRIRAEKTYGTETESVQITNNEENYQLLDVTGLSPSDAQLNFDTIYGTTHKVLNSAVDNNKNVVLFIRINGNVEENRQRLYQVFQTCSITRVFIETDYRLVYFDGYVDKLECGLFTNNQVISISLIGDYFVNVNKNKLVANKPADVESWKSTEFKFYNPSEVEEGLKLTVYGRSKLQQHGESFKLRLNLSDGTYKQLTFPLSPMASKLDRYLEVSTVFGKKYVSTYRTPDYDVSYYTSLVSYDSEFFSLLPNTDCSVSVLNIPDRSEQVTLEWDTLHKGV